MLLINPFLIIKLHALRDDATCVTPSPRPTHRPEMVQQMVVNAAATTIGLWLATLSYATRVVAGEAYQARLDALFGVRYEVRAPCIRTVVCSSAHRRLDTADVGLGLAAVHMRCGSLSA